MDLTSKNIEIEISEVDLIITSNSKLTCKKDLLTKEVLTKHIEEDSLSLSIENNSLSVLNYTKDLELNSYHFIPDNFETVITVEEITEEITDEDGNTEEVTEEVIEEVTVELYDFEIELTPGWHYFGVPLDLTNIIKTNSNNEDVLTDYTSLGIDVLLQDCLYEFASDDQPLYYTNESKYKQLLNMVKNVSGAIYKPSWDFNGIGLAGQFDGYEIQCFDQSIVIKLRGKILENISQLSDYNYEYPNGWNMFSFKSLSTDITAKDFVASYVAEDQIKIVKDDSGAVYMPEYDYNGIGYLVPGKAYQIRFD